MNDCVNAEMRDQLPDLVHDRLSGDARTIVLTHVEACADCRDEVQLLRDARVMFGRGIPRVDIAYVVGALPKAPAPRGAIKLESKRRTRSWSDWRIAAAVTLLIAGGGSYVVMQSGRVVNPADTLIVANPTTSTDSGLIPAADLAAMVAPGDDQPAAIGSMDARLGDLNEDQLNALLKDMDNLRAVPASEPEPVSLRGDTKASLEEM
jgi:hypothetical protein